MSNQKEKPAFSFSATGADRENPKKMAVSVFFKSKFRSFVKGENGNVAILTVLALAPLTALSLDTMDVYRISAIRAELQGAGDASMLPTAHHDRRRPVDDVVLSYLRRNVDPVLIDLRSVSVSEVDNSTPSTRSTPSTTDMALVLDLLRPMSGAKLIALRRASTDFIDTVLPPGSSSSTRVSVIPFGGSVNIDKRFQYTVDSLLIDSDNDGAEVRGFGGFLDHRDGHEWKGHFNLKASDFSPDDFTPGTHSFVPDFFGLANVKSLVSSS